MTEVRHDIARHTAGAAAHQQNTQGQGRFQAEHMYQQIGHTGHDDKLCAGTDEDIPRSMSQDTEVLRGKGKSHGQHDDSQYHRLRIAPHPVKGVRHKKSKYRHGNHRQ